MFIQIKMLKTKRLGTLTDDNGIIIAWNASILQSFNPLTLQILNPTRHFSFSEEDLNLIAPCDSGRISHNIHFR